MQRSAFTLIELLVVIAIIAILSTMLIPVIGMVRTQANNQLCMSNARQLSISILAYAGDNDGRVDVRASGHYSDSTAWPITLQAAGFIEDRRIYACPTSRHSSGVSWGAFIKGIANFSDVNTPSFADGCSNYAAHGASYNAPGMGTDPNGPAGTTGNGQGIIATVAQASGRDCLLAEVSPGGPAGYSWFGLGLTHWSTTTGSPTGFTVSWFDGGVTRCPTSKVQNYYDSIYCVAPDFER